MPLFAREPEFGPDFAVGADFYISLEAVSGNDPGATASSLELVAA